MGFKVPPPQTFWNSVISGFSSAVPICVSGSFVSLFRGGFWVSPQCVSTLSWGVAVPPQPAGFALLPVSLPHSSLIVPAGTPSSWGILQCCHCPGCWHPGFGRPCRPSFGALKQEPFRRLRQWSQDWKMLISLLGPIQKSFSFVHVLKEQEIFFFPFLLLKHSNSQLSKQWLKEPQTNITPNTWVIPSFVLFSIPGVEIINKILQQGWKPWAVAI